MHPPISTIHWLSEGMQYILILRHHIYQTKNKKQQQSSSKMEETCRWVFYSHGVIHSMYFVPLGHSPIYGGTLGTLSSEILQHSLYIVFRVF
jgi:hypothetical protein